MVGACVRGPSMNEAVGKEGRVVKWRVPLASATFCAACGRGAPTIVTFTDKVTLTIPSCYAHAHSKVGDRDAVSVVRADDQATASEGQLDIEDCSSTHLTAQLWATWMDGKRIEAQIDVALTAPPAQK